MKMRIVLLALLVALSVVGYAGFQYQRFASSQPSTAHEEKIVMIPKGASVAQIGDLLQEQGLLVDSLQFRRFVRIKGAAPSIRAGEFRFYTDMTPVQVLDVLQKGEEVRYKVTFPEGYNYKDMAKALSAIPFFTADKFLAIVSDASVAQKYGFKTNTLEGYLFPSTYEVTRSQTEKDLVDAMVRQFKAVWTPAFDQRAKELGMDMTKIVTLASVVEKETGAKDEQPTVSSVFHNRLKKGMKLESDPTIIYGLENFDGDIRRGDIRRNHPWNTYVIPGLPVTPICNPGKGAIEATLYPANTEFLYFVAKGNGAHSFSRTFAEHAIKVLEYQVRRRGQAAPNDAPPNDAAPAASAP